VIGPLLGAILSNPVFVLLVSFLESHIGATRREIEDFLSSIADLGAATMSHRRTSTYLGWLRHFGVVEERSGRFFLHGLPPGTLIVDIKNDEEPILPNRYDLTDYQAQSKRIKRDQEAIQYFVNQASRERANTAHDGLVNLMAEKLRAYGAIPKRNRYVDLAAKIDNEDYLFEMKSTTEENAHHQARRGLSQLYEYRYIQNLKDAHLVLVLESALPKKLDWMRDYIRTDREVLLLWDGTGRFYGEPETLKRLPFLKS
jgi:hypothetical protein